jgi:hypothetical protein
MKSKAGLLKNLQIGLILQKYFKARCDLVRRTDLEEETILDVMRILKEEFDS